MLLDNADDGESFILDNRGRASCSPELMPGRDDREVLPTVVDRVEFHPGDRKFLGAVRCAALAAVFPQLVEVAQGAIVRCRVGASAVRYRCSISAKRLRTGLWSRAAYRSRDGPKPHSQVTSRTFPDPSP